MSSTELLSVKDIDGFTPCQLADKNFSDVRSKGNPNKPGNSGSSEFSRTFMRHVMDPKFATIGPKIQRTAFWTPIKFMCFCFCISQVLSYMEWYNHYIRVLFVLCTLGPLGFLTKRQGHRIAHPAGLPNPYYKGKDGT